MEARTSLDTEVKIIQPYLATLFLDRFAKEQKIAYKEKRTNVRMGNPHYTTMSYLIHRYASQVNSNVDNLHKMDRLDGLITITSSLATKLKCSDRTIYNHIDRLMELKLIVKKEIYGRGIKLWISPEIIFKNQPRKNLKYADFPPKEEKFSDIISNDLEPFGIDSRYTVDCGKPKGLGSDTQEGVAGQLVLDNKPKHEVGNEHPTSKGLYGTFEKKQLPNCEKNSKKNEPQVPVPQKSRAETEEMHKMVADFIEFVIKTLYPNLVLLTSEYSQLFYIVKHTVFNDFKDKPINRPGKNGEEWDRLDWHDYYADWLIKRVVFAKRYFDQNFHLTIPPPLTYFSTTSKMNFHSTLAFQIKYEHGKRLSSLKWEVALSKKGRGKFPNRSMLDLYIIHQRRVASWNDPVLLTKFNMMAKKLYVQ